MSEVTGGDRWEPSGAETFLLAMEQGNVRLARFIVDALDGSILKARMEGGKTLLMCAILLPNTAQALSFAKLLLGKSAEVNSQDDEGRTALSHACQWGNVDTVRLLVQSNADPEIVDLWGNSSLIYGAWSGQVAVVDFLLRSFKRLGLDVNRTNAFGKSALDVAESLGHQDCAQVLASHGRRRSDREPSPLEDITFKRSPCGQNQILLTARGRERERRAEEWFLVPERKIKLGKEGPSKKPIQQHSSLQENLCGGSPGFSKASEMVSDIDPEYVNARNLFQLIDTPTWQETSRYGLGMKGPKLSSRPVISLDWDQQTQKTARLSEVKLNSALFRALRGSLKPVPALANCGGQVQFKVNGGQPKAQNFSKDTENRLMQEQEDVPQVKSTSCLDALSLQSHWGHSIALPGKQKESGPFTPQLNRKGTCKVAPTFRSFREGTPAPVAGGMALRSPDVKIGSTGNSRSQGNSSRKSPPLDSVQRPCWRCGQEETAPSQRVVSLPPVASPSTQHLHGPTLPRDTESRWGEAQTMEDDELEISLRLSDCELEGLQSTDGSYSPLAGSRGALVPQCQSTAKTCTTFSVLRLFRRSTMPQLKNPTEDWEGQDLGARDSGRQLPRSKTFPNSWQTVWAGDKLGVSRSRGGFNLSPSN